MDEQIANQQIQPEPVHPLGPVLVTCRPTPLLDWYKQLAPTTPAYVTLVGNLFASVFLAFMGATAAPVLNEV